MIDQCQADKFWSEISTTRTATAFRQVKWRTEKQLYKKILAEDHSINFQFVFCFSSVFIYLQTNFYFSLSETIYNAQKLEPHCAA